jgi:hypothetical protein
VNTKIQIAKPITRLNFYLYHLEVIDLKLESIMEFELFGRVRVLVVVVLGGVILLTLFMIILTIRTFKKIDKEEGNK